MANIYVSAIDGMGAITEPSPGTFDTTGMNDSNIMHIASDFLSEGVASRFTGDLKVTQDTGSNKNVKIAKGTGYVKSSSWVRDSRVVKYWRVEVDASDTLITIGDNTSGNPRIDIICLKVDPAASPDGSASNVATLVAVAGTPAASPSVPATPNNHLKLAEVAVANGFTTITNANITDKRPQASISGEGLGLTSGSGNNYKLTATVASNNLTVAVVDQWGNTPSEVTPVTFRVGNTTLRGIGALSVTINAGTNTFNAGATHILGNPVPLCVYAAHKAADDTLQIVVSRIFHARTYADFSGTATNDQYGAVSSALASTDVVAPIGWVEAQNGGTASFNWSIPASARVDSRPTRTSPRFGCLTGATGFSALTTDVQSYQISDNMVTAFINIVGTSNATSFGAAWPMAANASVYSAFGVSRDSGTSSQGLIQNTASSTAVTFLRVLSAAAGSAPTFTSTWTNSGDKRFNVIVQYFIA